LQIRRRGGEKSGWTCGNGEALYALKKGKGADNRDPVLGAIGRLKDHSVGEEIRTVVRTVAWGRVRER